jgi:hypothetical protein
MHKDIVDVLATDLAVTSLAERTPVDSDDRALQALASWTADIDADPMPDVDTPTPMAIRRRPRGALRSVAAMTLALTLSSTGIAAAVQGNPFAPINFVVHKFGYLGPSQHPPSVDLSGRRASAADRRAEREERAQADAKPRPSRSHPRAQPAEPAHRSEGTSKPALPSSDPVASRPVPSSRDGATAPSPRPGPRHRPLVIWHPRPPVLGPFGGQSPPDRPEPPSMPINTSPKPSFPGGGDEPAPPDQPTLWPTQSEPDISAPHISAWGN